MSNKAITFGKQVKDRLLALSMSQAELARRTDKSDFWISQVVNDQKQCSPQLGEAIAKVLDCCYVSMHTLVDADSCKELQAELQQVVNK